jgi:hypothetical protein
MDVILVSITSTMTMRLQEPAAVFGTDVSKPSIRKVN